MTETPSMIHDVENDADSVSDSSESLDGNLSEVPYEVLEKSFDKTRYKCTKCNKSCVTVDSIKKHYFWKHTEDAPNLYRTGLRKKALANGRFRCNQCYKLFRDNYELKMHSATHVEGRKCPMCHEFFKDPKDLYDHRTKGNCMSFYPCTLCGKQFIKHCGLTSHQKNCHNVVDTNGTQTVETSRIRTYSRLKQKAVKQEVIEK